MNPLEGNFYAVPENLLPAEFELYESLTETETVKIERIISTGQCTPEGQWLEDEKDEWVMLLRGESEISFENGFRKKLISGDYLLIPKNTRHRVEKTSAEVHCIWLAIYY